MAGRAVHRIVADCSTKQADREFELSKIELVVFEVIIADDAPSDKTIRRRARSLAMDTCE